MRRFILLSLYLFTVQYLYAQSTITIGIGSSLGVGAGSNVAIGYRDGTMTNTGTFNSRSITFDPVATAATSVTQSSFSANWNASSGATGYKLDVSTSSSFSSFVSGYQSLDVGSVTTYSVASNLSAGTTYYYRVRAYDIDGITGYSNVTTVVTAPLAPVASAATNINESSFSANWAASTGANKYYLDISTTSEFTAGTFVAGYENLNVGNVITYSITGLSANTTYYYRVKAANNYGTSNNSNTITVLTAPAPPAATAATPIAQTSFSANWNASVGATKYYLDVSTAANFSTFVTGYNNLDVGNVNTYSVNTNVTAGTTYYYRLRSTNGNGISTSSNAITVITIPPNPVIAAAANVLSTSFDAKWTAATSATKYYLDVSTDSEFGAGNFVTDYENKDVGNVVTFSVNTNILGGKTYYYRVRANNASGTSGNSGTTTLSTIPPAPVVTAATPIAQTSFSANWNAATGASKYYLDVSTDSEFGAGKFVTDYENKDVGDVVTFSVNTNLTAGTTYYYRVRAYSATGTSASSNTINLVTIPPDPTVIAATNITEAKFSANWNASTSATGYRLDVSAQSDFASRLVGYDDLNVNNVTTYEVTGLSAGTNYYYRIRAYNGSGTSGNTGQITQLTAPAVPIPLAAESITQTSFIAKWNSSVSATGYRLDVSTDENFSSGTFVTGYQNKDVGNVVSYTVDTYLVEGTTYYYRVRAYSAVATSTSSAKITLVTVPPAPVATSATSITATSFIANWNASTGATGYKLDVSTNSGFGDGTFVNGYQNKDVGNVTTYSVNTNLTEGITYYYRIRAYNDGGTSGYSGTITVSTVSTAPTSIAATSVEATKFTANWNSIAGASGYTLDVSTDAAFGSYFDGYHDLDVGNVTSFLVSGLSKGIEYHYRLKAYNVSGTSGYSNVTSVFTLSPAPVVTSATLITATSFSANWNSSTGATKYFLDVASDDGFTNYIGEFNNKDVGNVTTGSVTGLTAGHTYYYRVRAYNTSGSGQSSSTITVTTIPPSPAEQAASSITNNSFDANWTASTGASGYYLDVATDNLFASLVAEYNNKNIGNVITYSVTGLSGNTAYYYRVRAYNTGGTSGNSGTINTTTLPDPVTIPSVNPASNITATSFSANWKAVAGVSKYYLDVSAVSNFTSFVTGYNNLDVGNVTTYSVNTNLLAGNIYYYRLRAFNASGTSDNSNIVMVKTIPPAPVEQAATSIEATSFVANWNTSTGATGYYLDVATNAGFTSFVSGFNNRDVGNVNTYTVTGLTGSTPYYYQIRAYNTGGTSENSGAINPTTTAGSTVIATAATTITETGFNANWDAYAGTNSYKLYVATDADVTSYVGGYPISVASGVNTYAVTLLSGGTNYYYKVEAYDASATPVLLGTSGTINVITLPSAPTPSAATSISEISFDANWTASTSATGYYLDVATDDGFSTYVTGFQNKYVNNVLTYSVTGLAGGTNYYYRVRAKNGSGTGTSSTTITVLTIPHEPSATYATALTSTGFSANWNTSTNATGYKVDVSTVSNFGSFVGIYHDLNVNNVTGYSIAGLSGGTTYYYRVRAYNGSGTSYNSETVTALTLPSAPTSKSATSIAQTSFTANWEASVGAIKYYLDVATTSNFAGGTYINGYQNLDVSSALNYLVSGLTEGTSYYYRVRAFNSSGTSDNSGTVTVLSLPPDPNVLSATNIQSTSFTANWNASTSATGYKLDVSLVSNFASFVVGYNSLDVGNVTSRSVTGLSGGTTYYYRIKAYNDNGLSGYSGTVSVLIAPTAPVAISATSLTATSFAANWNTSTGADGYKIDVFTDAGLTTFVPGYNSKDVGATTSLTVTGLSSGTTYYYQVRSYSGGRTSSNSNTITTLTKPASPSAIAASSIKESSFIANWNTSTGATKYYLDVATDQGFTNFVATFNNKDAGNLTTCSVTGLLANTNYYYRVRAENASGISSNSGTITALTAPDIPTPAAATSITNTTAYANWSSSTGATGYKLDVSTVSDFASFVGGYNNYDVHNVTTYSISGLTGSTTYYYRVKSYNASATSSNSSNINFTTTVNPSGVPTATAATIITTNSFSANWNLVAGATGYKLDVSTDWNFSAGTFATDFQNKDVGNVNTISVTGLTNSTTYYYRLRSYNVSGTSSNSGSITVLTLPATPTAISATSLAVTSFNANWNSVTGATGYNLDVATNNTFTSFVAGYNDKDVSNVTTFSVSGLSGGTNYYYRVRAYNGTGAGASSNEITVLTIPSKPVSTSATLITETSFSANWNATTGAAGYYLDVATDNLFTNIITGLNNKDVSNVTTFSISGLTGGTNYYYRVRAYNTTDTSVNSDVITVLTVPSAPTAIAATLVTEMSFSANWNPCTGATKYYVDVSTVSDFSSFVGVYNNLDVGNVTTFTITSLSVNTNYYYRVRSYNGSTASGNSNVITVLTAPPIPIATAATLPGENSFVANWNSSLGATGYKLDVATNNSFNVGSFETDYEDKDVGNIVTFSVSGLTSSTTHYYRIRAYNTGGTSNNSGTIKVLGVPHANQAMAVTLTSFSANWDAVAGITGYRLDVSTDINFGAGSFVAGYQNKDVGNVTTYPLAGLIPNTTYYYRVRSYDLSGSSGNSNTVLVKNLPNPPVATAATNIGSTSFTANWNTSAGGASGYKLDVATDANFSNFVADYQKKVVYNVTSFTVNNLSSGTNYYYRVRAYNSLGNSDSSNAIGVLTLPAAPINSISDITQTSFYAKWNSVNGASGYLIDVSTNENFITGTFITGYQDYNVGNVEACIVNGLTPGVTYYYRVRSYNTTGESENSKTISVITLPTTPIGKIATSITSSGFTANWNSVQGATGYYLDVAIDTNFTSFVYNLKGLNVNNVSSHTITGLTAGTTYYYRLRAYNESGTNLIASNSISVLTLPTKVVALSATSITSNGFTANWNLVQGTLGYYLDITTDINFSNGTFVSGYQNKDVGNVTSFSVSTNLIDGTKYYYRIRAYNSSGTSENSNIIEVTTVIGKPTAIAATNISSTSFTANWNALTGATKYFIDIATDINFTCFVDGWNNKDVGNVTTYIINTNIIGGTKYYYRIRAYNSSGISENSNTIEVITISEKPTATAATNIFCTSFAANWTTSTSAIGYKLDIATDAAFTTYLTGFNNLDVSNVLAYSVTNLNPGTKYYYRIRAYNASGTSDNSNTIEVITISEKPTATAATNISSTSFIANWNASTGAAKYFVDIATDINFTTFINGWNNKDVGNATACSLNNLSSQTSYYYRIRAYNNSGISENSNIIQVTTLQEVPASVIALSATEVKTTSFIANWTSLNSATGYYLDVATDQGFTSLLSGYNGKDVGNTASFQVNGLTQGTRLYYRVRGYNSGGTGANSNIIIVDLQLESPTGLMATTDPSGYIQLNWQFDFSTQIIGFIIYREAINNSSNLKKINDDNFVVIDTVKGHVTTYIDKNVVEGISYLYRVIAYNGTGSTSDSNSAGSSIPTPIYTPLKTPDNLTGIVGSNKIVLKWDDNSTTEEGFIIERSDNSNSNFIIISRVGKNESTYSDENIKNGVLYYYRVASYKAQEKSAYSNELSIAGVVTAVKELSLGIPDKFQLYQNYPNPFNPSTVIRFGLPKDCHVKIVIYNVLGSEVATLLNDDCSAGYCEVKFDAGRFSSGIYIYRIESKEFTQTMKMILMK